MLQNLITAAVQPFRATPDARFYFEHPSIEAARQTILRAVIRAEGPVAVLGGSGYGKSLLADLVADQLCQRLDIVMLQSARLSSRRALLQSILFGLKLPYLDMSEGELRLSILDRLEPSPETAPEGVLILVDEAHTLHWKLLDELRLISNFTRNHQPRVKLVLFGNLRLEEILASPQLDSFNQRLAARCYLQPMSRTETVGYIQHQLRECGVEPASIITQEALNSVYSASEGIPRLVNQLMDHAIWLASNSAQSPISAALINEAWSDLQQLPTPWTSGKNETTPMSASIEFGHLPDDDVDQEELGFAPEKRLPPANMNPALPDFAEVQSTDQNRSAFSESRSATPITTACEVPTGSSVAPHVQVRVEFPSVSTVRSQEASTAKSHPVNSQSITTSGTELSTDSSTASDRASNSSAKHLQDSVAAEYRPLEEDSNFFAAFQPTATSQYLDVMDDGSEDDRWRVKAEASRRFELEISLASPSEMPLADFDTQSIPLSPTVQEDFSWFAPQPSPQAEPSANIDSSDQERIASLMAEQQQYDAMGVWENDPPLAGPNSQQTGQNAVGGDKLQTIFGGDFDDEKIISLDSPIVTRRSATTQVPAATTGSAASAGRPLPEAASDYATSDYLIRMEQYADALTAAARISTAATGEASPATESAVPAGATDNSVLAGALWSIDVGTTSAAELSTKPLEESIEELVSKLNFSAFSMEPFSVEQIPLEPSTKSIPYDSVRRGSNEEVYLMHRPLVEKPQIEKPRELMEEPFDDDRDLLIVEEEIPVSLKTIEAKSNDQPAQKAVSYSRLFAKLRK